MGSMSPSPLTVVFRTGRFVFFLLYRALNRSEHFSLKYHKVFVKSIDFKAPYIHNF